MKKNFIILTLAIIILFGMTGCINDDNPTQTNESPTTKTTTSSNTLNEEKAYQQLINLYTTALKDKWGGSDLIINDISLMLVDCYGNAPLKNIGYTLLDLDDDGVKELIISTTNVITDEFYGKLIFDVYSLKDNGSLVKILSSTERNRYYYIGENKFANLGSNSAGNEINTTIKIENGKLIDIKQSTMPSNYVQLQLTLMK